MSRIHYGVYTPRDNDEALALERECPQGTSFRMSFRRPAFHRRAENYERWRIFTARDGERLVGLTAAAIKDVVIRGSDTRAGFFFDARVHPEVRRKGIGRRLAQAAYDWSMGEASFAYTYTLAENRVAARLVRLFGGVDVGGYAYLVYPCHRKREPGCAPRPATFEEVHAALMAHPPPFDLYSNPRCEPGRGGYLASWIADRKGEKAGCSIWSNEQILAEVIERVPLAVRLAGSVSGLPFVRSYPWPAFPRPGRVIRSWYLFDFFATDRDLARGLMRHVANQAREQGIEFCYLAHDPREPWVDALRSDVPRLFSPVIPYRMLMRSRSGGPPDLDRIYVDVRDL